jgi:hypothetical protein
VSWGATVTSTPKGEVEEKLAESFATNYSEAGPEVQEQFEVALAAVGKILNTIAGTAELYHANANGHVKQADSPAASFINVSVGGH